MLNRMKKRHLIVNKNSFYVFTIALFICSSIIKSFLADFSPRPAIVALLLLYTVLIASILLKRINSKDLIRAAVPIIVLWILVIWTWIFYPERHFFYHNSLYNLMDVAFPIYGAYITSICMLETKHENLLKSIRISSFIMILYHIYQVMDPIKNGIWTRASIYNGQIVTIKSNYNLNWGYGVYVICVIFFSLFFLDKRKIDIIIPIIGLIGIFLYGSRGPILIFAIYVILAILLYSKRKIGKKIIALSVIIIVVLFLLANGWLEAVIIAFADKYNFSSRTIQKILGGTLTDTSGRALIYGTILSKIRESPIIGWGIFSDRYFLNTIAQGGSAYSHNIILEMAVSFGIPGIAFFVLIVVKIINWFRSNNEISTRVLMLIAMGSCLPLFLSLSFWSHSMFWVLLAILFNYSNKRTVNQSGEQNK